MIWCFTDLRHLWAGVFPALRRFCLPRLGTRCLSVLVPRWKVTKRHPALVNNARPWRYLHGGVNSDNISTLNSNSMKKFPNTDYIFSALQRVLLPDYNIGDSPRVRRFTPAIHRGLTARRNLLTMIRLLLLGIPLHLATSSWAFAAIRCDSQWYPVRVNATRCW